MSKGYQWDAIRNLGSNDGLFLPYNKIARPLSNFPRLVGGQNTYINTGGSLQRRPGTTAFPGTPVGPPGRVDRALIYETMDTPPYVYLIMSVFVAADGVWKVYYLKLDTASAVTQFTELRNINHSTVAHELIQARGKVYIKGVAAQSFTPDTDLNCVIFDGTGGTVAVQPWGIMEPNATVVGDDLLYSAQVDCNYGNITADITASTVDFHFVFLNNPSVPTPFVLNLEYEQINVTAFSTSGFNYHITACTRGYNGTLAAAHKAGTFGRALVTQSGSIWDTSDVAFTVNQGWTYATANIDINDNYSNRTIVPINGQNNINGISVGPGSTGPFFNQIPKVHILENGDSTNYPSVAVLRTTDGGGTFYILDIVDNNGGTSSYTDNIATNNNFASLGTYPQDYPVPDSLLTQFGPGLTTNSPPPNNIAPSVVGFDATQKSTPLAYYQGRIWYGIGNILFFSAQEELIIGVPEECFPSGVNGNFFRFQELITNVLAVTTGLYVFTLTKTYFLTGSDLQSFSYVPLFDNLGHPWGHPRALARYGENICFLGNDYRVAIVENGVLHTISDPLGSDIVDAINAGGEADIKYYANRDKEWLVVAVHNNTTQSLSRQWVYDINKSKPQPGEAESLFWNPPWSYPSCCLASGRISQSSPETFLQFFGTNTAFSSTTLAQMDLTGTVATDYTIDSSTATFDVEAITNLVQVPAGDHVNERRVPGIVPNVYSVIVERLKYSGDTDPFIYWYKDDIWTQAISAPFSEDPARITQTLGYTTTEYPVNEVAKRFALRIFKPNSYELLDVQNIDVIYEPNGGS